MPAKDISRRQFLGTAAALGVIAVVRPLAPAEAAMMPSAVGRDPQWFQGGRLRYRRDGMAKVTGSKVFSLDMRARDVEGWPDRQSHAMTLHLPRADRVWQALDLSVLGDALQPDVLIDDAEMARRKAAWKAPAPRHAAGLLSKYAQLVGQADKGAVTHAGKAEWPEQ